MIHEKTGVELGIDQRPFGVYSCAHFETPVCPKSNVVSDHGIPLVFPAVAQQLMEVFVEGSDHLEPVACGDGEAGDDGDVVDEWGDDGLGHLVTGTDVGAGVPDLAVAHGQRQVAWLLAVAEVQFVQILSPELVVKNGKEGIGVDLGK